MEGTYHIIYNKNKDNNMPDSEMSEEDYLKRHLQGIDETKQNSKQNEFVESNTTNYINVENTKVSDLQFFNYDIKDLPCGQFYPQGTLFMVRPAQVIEIQAYSMVDDTNVHDMIEKMNDMLQACVRVKYTDGKVASYLDIKDPDRIFLIFLIRELTFQQGTSLSVNTSCECGQAMQIELKRSNFVFNEIDENLAKFYNKSTGSYNFETINGKTFEMTPPNIGLQKAFTDYIIKESNDKKAPNLSFLKVIPFLLNGRSNITYEGIKSKLQEYQSIDDVSFQFLNAAVGKMTFGIKELKKVCSCGVEVHTDMEFPNGASGIFVIHDAFEAYIKK